MAEIEVPVCAYLLELCLAQADKMWQAHEQYHAAEAHLLLLPALIPMMIAQALRQSPKMMNMCMGNRESIFGFRASMRRAANAVTESLWGYSKF